MSEREKQTREAASQQAIQAASQPPTKRLGEKSKPRVPGMAPGKSRVQMRRAGSETGDVHAAAARGVASPTTRLPFADKIQASFGDAHDVSKIQAHIGGDSAGEMGANAYASGNHVVFDREPDLHTAAHEAAHVIQQAHGVNLYGGVGEAGDAYERHADEVADRVVAGRSAADLLGTPTGNAAPASGVQMKQKPSQEEMQLEAEKSFERSLAGVLAGLESQTRMVYAATASLSRVPSSKMTPRGYGGQALECEEEYKRVESIVLCLARAVNKQSAKERKALQPSMMRFNVAFDTFSTEWETAKNYVAGKGYSLSSNTDELRKKLVSINYDLKLDKEYALGGARDSARVSGSDDELQAVAIQTNLTAIEQLAKFVPMTAKGSDVRSFHLARLPGHMCELAGLLPRDATDPRAKQFKSKLRVALAQVHEVEQAISKDSVALAKLHVHGWAESHAAIKTTAGVP